MSRKTDRTPLRALFLDVGGTLLEERVPRWTLYAEAAARRGVDVSAERMHELMREAHHALPRELAGAFRYTDPWFRAFIERIFGLGLGLPGAEVEALTGELFATFEDAATFRLFEGARELLADLRGHGLRLGIVSNWSARLPRLLDALALSDAFDFVLCSALEGCEKPEPAIFAEALRRAGVRPGEACHVGDQPRYDVDGPRAVGIEAVLVDHTGRGAPEGYDGIARVRSFAELARHLEPRLP